jgi:hypothetical protein
MSDEVKTYTQDEIDSIVKAELAKVRKQHEYFTAEYDAEMARLEELKRILEANEPSPELIKARKRVETLRAESEELRVSSLS